MYIKREPLGRGHLTFGKRRRRYPLALVILYLAILAAALFVYVRMDAIQPRVLAMIGPPPAPTVSPDELAAQGHAAYTDGDLQTAVDLYSQAAELDSTNVQILFDYARLLTMTYRFDEALTVADQTILIAPEDPRGYAARARALDWMGEYEHAQIEALQAIELDPDFALGHAYLAEAYADLGRYRQALEQAELAIQLDPYSVDARRNYAYVLEFYGDYQGAIQQYIQALQLHSNLLDLWYGLARNYRGAGQMDRSVETYAEIGQRTPDDPYLYVEWGKTYFEMRDDQAAQETLEQAVFLVCDQNQADVPEDERISCPLLSSDTLFDDSADSRWDDPSVPLEQRIPWDAANREVPPYVMISAWNRLGQVYLTRRNYEDAIAILSEAIAWGEAQDEDSLGYQPVPIESYYVMASAYYYRNQCEFAVPLTVHAFRIYQQRELDDPGALENILKLFVLCRDYTVEPGDAVVHEGPGFTSGFPDGYQEPEVIIERPGSGDEDEDGDGSSDN
jgi:tetratricopeptide (TPR) repeat protein